MKILLRKRFISYVGIAFFLLFLQFNDKSKQDESAMRRALLRITICQANSPIVTQTLALLHNS